mmetsp:Transcript_20390/g.81547  ORF Transcript_20390/g.81547 Transcript_20390/m.81547 type:complete len:249 (-) Transcript_20390:179-925(-)
MALEKVARRVKTPASAKMSVLPKYSTACQTFSNASCETTKGHTRYASTRPAATVVRMPEVLTVDSPRKKAKYAVQSVMASWTNVSDSECSDEARLIQYVAIAPMAKPRMGETKTMRAKNSTTSLAEYVLSRATSKKIVNSTMAEPSFNSDSPVICIVSVADAPTALSNATTATGSVAANTEPSVMHSEKDQSSYGRSHLTNTAVAPAPMTTPGPASNSACQNTFSKTCTLSDMTSPNNNAGKNAYNTK